MNIDLIKWMVGYGKGFEMFSDDIIRYIDQLGYPHDFIIPKKRIVCLSSWCFYSLLLWKAIMGIDVSVSISSGYIEMGDPDDPFYGKRVSEFDNLDHAIEQALKYIYEQEKK